MVEGFEGEVTRFTFGNAVDASWEWAEKYTRLHWLLLIGIVLCVIFPLIGWIEWGVVSKMLWIFPVVFGLWLIIAVIYYKKYDLKVVVEMEVSEKEYKGKLLYSAKWLGGGTPRMIMQIKWKKLGEAVNIRDTEYFRYCNCEACEYFMGACKYPDDPDVDGNYCYSRVNKDACTGDKR